MGFFRNPLKSFKGFVNNFVPGGKYLTGHAAERQKFHYNRALGRYNSEVAASQAQIEILRKSLEESMQSLQSIEERRMNSAQKEYDIHRQARDHERQLSDFEREKSKLEKEASSLKSDFDSFKVKAPALSAMISEYEELPNLFQESYEKLKKQKEGLTGLSHEEAASHIEKYKADLEDLKSIREKTEGLVRDSLSGIESQHRDLAHDKATLEGRLDAYKFRQNKLEQKNNDFTAAKTNLQKIIADYKNEQEQLASEYSSKRASHEQLKNQLSAYTSSAQGKLDEIAKEVGWRASKYKRESRTTGLARGIGLSLATFGAGSGLGGLAGSAGSGLLGSALGSLASGVQFMAPFVGIGTYINGLSKARNLGNFERVNLNDSMQQTDETSSHQARYYGDTGRLSIPELGGLKQSLAHFDMPSVPKLKDLPKLHEALGKITSLKDIESLRLGLPSMTSASGKKYSTEVLYNPEFIKKFKKISRSFAHPYLRTNTNNAGAAYG